MTIITRPVAAGIAVLLITLISNSASGAVADTQVMDNTTTANRINTSPDADITPGLSPEIDCRLFAAYKSQSPMTKQRYHGEHPGNY